MAYLDGGGNNQKNKKNEKFWDMPGRIPNEEEKSKMISKSIEIVTKEVMSKHFYAVGDTVRKQSDGGAHWVTINGGNSQDCDVMVG